MPKGDTHKVLGDVKHKRCATCKTFKKLTEFASNRSRWDGLCWQCRNCNATRVSRSEQYAKVHGKAVRKWKLKNPEKVTFLNWKSHLKRKFGLTVDAYNELFRQQEGVCAICALPPNGARLTIDHCHETGVIRGLLHVNCNSAIGLLKDDPSLLFKAGQYLKSSGGYYNR